jgi:metal-responsive CopG/Arc/MetJ family transcriptional regulator
MAKEKISVTLPADLVREIRSIVPEKGISRFLTEAVGEKLVKYKLNRALKEGYGAWSSEKHPELKTSEDSTALVRELRERDNERLSHLKKG